MFDRLVEKLKEKFVELKACKTMNIFWKDINEKKILIKDNDDLESAMEDSIDESHMAGPNTSDTTESNNNKTELNIWVTYEDENQEGKFRIIK